MRPALPVLLACLLPCACAHRGPLPLSPTERPGDVVRFKPGQPVPEVLRAKAQPVAPDDGALPALIESLRAELERSGGVGLAAPQVGVSRRAVVVKRHTRPKGETAVEAYVNPVVEERSEETELDWEACLSVDGGGGQVRRARRLVVSFDVPGGGARQRVVLVDWDARIAQHELDHLDGVLFTDKLEGPLVPLEEMRRERDRLHLERGWIAPPAGQ